MIDPNTVYSIVQFTFVNRSPSVSRTVDIFSNSDSYIASEVAKIPTNPADLFYVTGTTNYWQFLRDASEAPKMIRNIRVNGTNGGTVLQPMNVQYKDITGVQYNNPKLASTNTSAYQFQTLIVDIPFKPMEFVVDNDMEIINYTFRFNTITTMSVYYKQANDISYRNGVLNKYSVCKDIDICQENSMTITEEELQKQLTTNIMEVFNG